MSEKIHDDGLTVDTDSPLYDHFVHFMQRVHKNICNSSKTLRAFLYIQNQFSYFRQLKHTGTKITVQLQKVATTFANENSKDDYISDTNQDLQKVINMWERLY
jgi:hypothetical protein